MSTAAPRRIAIAGLGLIGGSLGMALRARGWHVSYVDPHVSLDAARAARAADERVEDLRDANAEVVMLATPVDVAIRLLETADFGEAVVTSAGSVLAPLRHAADTRGIRFIAGHPLAGSHARSLGAAKETLFEGQTWFLDDEDPLVEQLVRDSGATIERVNADEHDAAVALTSHLPQILSTALAAHLADAGDLRRFAGSGLRTFLRLAASDPGVWGPVIAANREQIAPHADAVAELVRAILAGDVSAFDRAQRWMRG